MNQNKTFRACTRANNELLNRRSGNILECGQHFWGQIVGHETHKKHIFAHSQITLQRHVLVHNLQQTVVNKACDIGIQKFKFYIFTCKLKARVCIDARICALEHHCRAFSVLAPWNYFDCKLKAILALQLDESKIIAEQVL